MPQRARQPEITTEGTRPPPTQMPGALRGPWPGCLAQAGAKEEGSGVRQRRTRLPLGKARLGRAHRAQSQRRSGPAPVSSPAPLQEDFVYEDIEALCGELRTLATDSNKYRAKADRRRQRSTFRAVLHFIEVRVQRQWSATPLIPGHSGHSRRAQSWPLSPVGRRV